MRRHIYLRENGDKAILCVTDDLAHVVLTIKAARRRRLSCHGRKEFTPTTSAGYTPCTMLGKPGQTFDLDTPALVVAEVQMKRIVFIANHLVDIAFDLLLCEEMTTNIKHETAPAKTGIVGDVRTGDGCFCGAAGRSSAAGRGPCCKVRRQKLQQGLQAVKNARRIIRLQPDTGRRDRKCITFFSKYIPVGHIAYLQDL